MTMIRNEADIAAGLATLAALDPRLGPVIAASGPVPLRLRERGFSGLAHIVVSQMISRASADAIWHRILAATGEPTADAWLNVSRETLAGFGLSRSKAVTLDIVARAVADGVLDLHAVCSLDGEEAMRQLTALHGIGPWTAEVYLMFCAGHGDIFPVGDVALRAAVSHAFGLDERITPKELTRLAAQWQPWRSVAARLFWSWYAVKLQKNLLPVP